LILNGINTLKRFLKVQYWDPNLGRRWRMRNEWRKNPNQMGLTEYGEWSEDALFTRGSCRWFVRCHNSI